MEEERCSVRLTRRYDASPAEVWRALTDPASRARWLGALDGEVREVEPGRLLELELHDSLARIELHRDGDRTVLVLDHAAIPAARGMRAIRVWTAALARLEERL